jgi:hypothetical protein
MTYYVVVEQTLYFMWKSLSVSVEDNSDAEAEVFSPVVLNDRTHERPGREFM